MLVYMVSGSVAIDPIESSSCISLLRWYVCEHHVTSFELVIGADSLSPSLSFSQHAHFFSLSFLFISVSLFSFFLLSQYLKGYMFEDSDDADSATDRSPLVRQQPADDDTLHRHTHIITGYLSIFEVIVLVSVLFINCNNKILV